MPRMKAGSSDACAIVSYELVTPGTQLTITRDRVVKTKQQSQFPLQERHNCTQYVVPHHPRKPVRRSVHRRDVGPNFYT